MNRFDIEAIEARAAAALARSPYPWAARPLEYAPPAPGYRGGVIWEVVECMGEDPGDESEQFDAFEDPPKEVAEFTAACREDVPALCTHVRHLEETLREVLAVFCLSASECSWWLAAGRVDLETMARWRTVAGLEEGGK